MSVLEAVRITAHAGERDTLLEALRRGLSLQAADAECESIRVYESVERPDECLLLLEWTSIEAHLRWQESSRSAWRKAVGWEVKVLASEGLKHYRQSFQLK